MATNDPTMQPRSREQLHRLLDAFDDKHLLIAGWFLNTAAGLCMGPVEGALAFDDERMSLQGRWFMTLNNFIAGAPSDWFTDPEQRGRMMKALAEQAATAVSE